MAWQVSYPVCILVMSTSTQVINDKSIGDNDVQVTVHHDKFL